MYRGGRFNENREAVALFKIPFRDENYLFVSRDTSITDSPSSAYGLFIGPAHKMGGMPVMKVVEFEGAISISVGGSSCLVIPSSEDKAKGSLPTWNELRIDELSLERHDIEQIGSIMARITAVHASDWTVDPATGRSNSSREFEKLVDVVHDIIYDSASDLIAGNGRNTARLIVAQLVHKHGLAPTKTSAKV